MIKEGWSVLITQHRPLTVHDPENDLRRKNCMDYFFIWAFKTLGA